MKNEGEVGFLAAAAAATVELIVGDVRVVLLLLLLLLLSVERLCLLLTDLDLFLGIISWNFDLRNMEN